MRLGGFWCEIFGGNCKIQKVEYFLLNVGIFSYFYVNNISDYDTFDVG